MLKNTLINIEIDENILKKIVHEEIKSKIREFTFDKVFYDMNDLVEITSFSKGHIYNTFFYDERFIKIRRKAGSKHVFPVTATNKFLLEWIKEQPTD